MIGLRTLYREELAQRLVTTLDHRRPSIRSMTATVLGEMGSFGSAPHLVKALQDPEESVRMAAGQALTRITGQALPASYEAWSLWLMPPT